MTASAGGCPSPDQLERLLGEELADADRTAVESHVETCTACQERLERLAASTVPPATPATDSARGGAPGPEPGEDFLERLRRLPPPVPGTGATTTLADRGMPKNLGPYEILGRVGAGGMGTVYKARHRELDKVVALKVLPADRVDEAAVARFRNEMKAAGRLGHTNIVTAHDAGRVGGTYYLAMDFVDGSDLAALVYRLGPLPIPDACELVRQAAVGLQHACECGLAHRDVKPSNLMLARGGVVKVLDLGLARSLADVPAVDRLTATGVLLGTADYVAPEQIDRAHAADARSDVYGLGGTLYFLLTGSPPFGGTEYGTWLQKLRAHAEAPVPPVRRQRPEVPAALAALLERMLAKDPADRPATPGAVAEALRPFAAGADLPALLDRTGAITPRPAAPGTHTSGRRPGVRAVALRYGITAAAGALAALLAVLPFLRTGRGQIDDTRGLTSPGSPAAEPHAPDPEEGVRLTYGAYGPPRPDHRVLPGEDIHLDLVTRGAGKDEKGNVDFSIAGELVDKDGKKWAELAPVPIKGPLYRGGSTLNSRASFELSPRQPPGEYRAKARVTDKITGRVVNFEHPVYVLRPEFGVVRLRLTHDQEGKLPAGSHLTEGQQFFVQMRLVDFEHKDGRIRVSVTVSARDRDGKDTMLSPMKPLNIDQKVEDAFGYFDLSSGLLRTIMAGEAVITVEAEDVIGRKKVSYELPVVIHPPRSTSGKER
jgi:tRNA A-37 threonylcarbamoyl transferase component Bud32